MKAYDRLPGGGRVAGFAFEYDERDLVTAKTIDWGDVLSTGTETYEYNRNGMLTKATERRLDPAVAAAIARSERDTNGQGAFVDGAGLFASLAAGVGARAPASVFATGFTVAGERVGAGYDTVFAPEALSVWYRDGSTWKELGKDDWRLSEDEGGLAVAFSRPVASDAFKLRSASDERDIEGEAVYAPWRSDSAGVSAFLETETCYAYDAKGNRDRVTTWRNGAYSTETYDYEAGSDRIARAGEIAFAYDGAGRVLAKGRRDAAGAWVHDADYRGYAYDLAGCMVASARYEGGTLVETAYEYWPDGVLASRTEGATRTTYAYGAGVELLSETTGAITKDYVWIGGRLVGEKRVNGAEVARTWFLTDQVGSVIAALDWLGRVKYRNEFDAFGGSNAYGFETDTARFTGKQYDEGAGLYYFNARWYDHGTGRFTTEDPARDGDNWYAYCGNEPMMRTDPTGLHGELQPLSINDAPGAGPGTPPKPPEPPKPPVTTTTSGGSGTTYTGPMSPSSPPTSSSGTNVAAFAVVPQFDAAQAATMAQAAMTAQYQELAAAQQAMSGQATDSAGWSWVEFWTGFGDGLSDINTNLTIMVAGMAFGSFGTFVATAYLADRAGIEMVAAAVGLIQDPAGAMESISYSLTDGLDYTLGFLTPGFILSAGIGVAFIMETVAGSNAAAITNVKFGRTPNQVYHTFRHLVEKGVDVAAASTAILDDLKNVGYLFQPGIAYNQAVDVGGRIIVYTAFLLPDGTLNIGRIVVR